MHPETPASLRLVLAALLAGVSLTAQSQPLFDSFAYAQPWSAAPGQYEPQAAPALVQLSENGVWHKVVWAKAPGWPLVDYLAENVTTTSGGGPSRILLTVTPKPTTSDPAGGAEVISTNKVTFGSYRMRAKASPRPRWGRARATHFISTATARSSWMSSS